MVVNRPPGGGDGAQKGKETYVEGSGKVIVGLNNVHVRGFAVFGRAALKHCLVAVHRALYGTRGVGFR